MKSIINKIKFVNPGFMEKLFPWVMCYGDRGKKEIYLTFDDGPYPVYTYQILDILDKYNIRGVFFLEGSKVEKYPEIVKDIYDQGHIAGNHSYSHQSLLFKSSNFILEEIRKTDDVINDITGLKPVFFRPPYGRFDLRFKRIMQQTGHKLVLWSLLSYDYSCIRKESIFNIVRKNAVSGSIIVFHDGLETSRVTIEVIPEIIEYFLNEGYIFSVL
ncbi:polysaccharide deacetylase family protein [bacterium]|nr:polysaccharide deacetylase family protein [bacterium]